eukprot:2448923-Prymnesium_polylepis.1
MRAASTFSQRGGAAAYKLSLKGVRLRLLFALLTVVHTVIGTGRLLLVLGLNRPAIPDLVFATVDNAAEAV